MTATRATAWDVAAQVTDPELPWLTVADLGILRDVEQDGDTVVVTFTPTYSGCPAIREITADLARALREHGFDDVRIEQRLEPPWSSDWVTADGRRKLAAAGIAPPRPARRHTGPVPLTLGGPPAARCPRCGSVDTSTTARFSGTACKALHFCAACAEPFEAVKPL